MDYGFVHAGKVFTPDGTQVSPKDNDERNRAIEAAALAQWQQQPDSFVAYYDFPTERRNRAIDGSRPYRDSFYPTIGRDANVKTWLGTRIGDITEARVYSHNFGSRFVAIRVRGTNGAEYYGRASWDNGEVIHLRRAK